MAVIFSFFLGTSCRRPAPGVQIPAGTFRDCPTFWDRPHCVNRVCGRKPTRQVFFTFVIPLWSFHPAKTCGAVLALLVVRYNIFLAGRPCNDSSFSVRKIQFSTWSLKSLGFRVSSQSKGLSTQVSGTFLSTPVFHHRKKRFVNLIINKPRYSGIVLKDGAQYSGIRYILERSCCSSCKKIRFDSYLFF